jgi:hypothetical protein
MIRSESAVAQFATHDEAEAAIRQLHTAGFDISQISIIGRGYHVDEQVLGFYNQGDRIRFWGARGAFWGGLWGLFFGGVLISLPITGPIIVLGYMATTLVAVMESAAVVGAASAIAAALYGLGIPKDSVLAYETALAADRFLVIVHGRAARIAQAKQVLLEECGAEAVATHKLTTDSLMPTLAMR